MGWEWLIDSADINGFSSLTLSQLKRAKLLRLAKLSNLTKEARQIRSLRKKTNQDIQEIERLIGAVMQVVEFPAPVQQLEPTEIKKTA